MNRAGKNLKKGEQKISYSDFYINSILSTIKKGSKKNSEFDNLLKQIYKIITKIHSHLNDQCIYKHFRVRATLIYFSFNFRIDGRISTPVNGAKLVNGV